MAARLRQVIEEGEEDLDTLDRLNSWVVGHHLFGRLHWTRKNAVSTTNAQNEAAKRGESVGIEPSKCN